MGNWNWYVKFKKKVFLSVHLNAFNKLSCATIAITSFRIFSSVQRSFPHPFPACPHSCFNPRNSTVYALICPTLDLLCEQNYGASGLLSLGLLS